MHDIPYRASSRISQPELPILLPGHTRANDGLNRGSRQIRDSLIVVVSDPTGSDYQIRHRRTVGTSQPTRLRYSRGEVAVKSHRGCEQRRTVMTVGPG